MEQLKKFFYNKRILITGHTGFKGSWLTFWLLKYNANIIGISKDLPSNPNMHKVLGNEKNLKNYRLDICREKSIKKVFKNHKPQIVFHLAAQAIVSESFKVPKETYMSNVIGTMSVLEAIRETPSVKSVVIVTSDKCYDMKSQKVFIESDPLGGRDIYSSSKASCEILVSSYRDSFLSKTSSPRVATVRAGNVIGGGDWSKNRILPDIFRAIQKKKPLYIRNPSATRPWQHVLDPLHGYMILAKKLYDKKKGFDQAWNFGPEPRNVKNVKKIVEDINITWNLKIKSILIKKKNFKEEQILKLNSTKAKKLLKWKPLLPYNETIKLTVDWYRKYLENKNMKTFTLKQIEFFEKLIDDKI